MQIFGKISETRELNERCDFENKVNNIALDLCLLVSFTKNKISKAISYVSSLSQK